MGINHSDLKLNFIIPLLGNLPVIGKEIVKKKKKQTNIEQEYNTWKSKQNYFLISFPRGMFWASLIAQLVKNPPAIQETPVRFLGWKDPLEKE